MVGHVADEDHIDPRHVGISIIEMSYRVGGHERERKRHIAKPPPRYVERRRRSIDTGVGSDRHVSEGGVGKTAWMTKNLAQMSHRATLDRCRPAGSRS